MDTSASSGDHSSTPTNMVMASLPTATIEVMAVPTGANTASAISPTAEKPYEVLEPNKIMTGDFTVEINVYLYTT